MDASENATRRKWLLYGLLIAVALWMLLLAVLGVLVMYMASISTGRPMARFGLGAIGVAMVLLPAILGIIVLRRRAEFTRSVQTMLQIATDRREVQQPLWLRIFYAAVWTGMSVLWLHRAMARGSVLAWTADGLFMLAALLSIRQIFFPSGK